MLSNFVWMNSGLLDWNHAQAGSETGVTGNQAWTIANHTKSSKIIEHIVPTLWNETLCTRQVLFDGHTGKPLSEALIFASTNPQYDDRLFIELQLQYMKIPSSNLGRTCLYRNYFWHSEQFLYTTCFPMFCKKKSFWQRFTCILNFLQCLVYCDKQFWTEFFFKKSILFFDLTCSY